MEEKKNLKIGIALGGGGVCGFAHIGFLQVLEENGIKPDIISGVSMGAIIGAFYASGYTLDEIEEKVKSIKKSDLFKLNAFRILKEGLISGKKIEKFLEKNLKVKNIEECNIPFYAGATDLKTGRSHYFDKGDIVQALRASTAIPGVFPAVNANGTSYVDGGTSENVPFKILRSKGADVVIACDCINLYKKEEVKTSMISALVSSVEILQYISNCSNLKLNRDKVDVYCIDSTEGVTPQTIDLKLIPKVIESGRQCALKHLDQIKKMIEKKEKVLENTCVL